MLGKLSFTNKKVAKNLNIPEERVSKVMTFVTGELYSQMVQCEVPFIYVRDLGTFALNPAAVDRSLRQIIRILKGHEKKAGESGYPLRARRIEALREEIFYLFRVRRMMKKQRKNLKLLRNAGKAVNDLKG